MAAPKKPRPEVDALCTRLSLPASASGYLYGLAAKEADTLCAAIGKAEAAQQKAVDTAINGALDQVPMLLRGPVRKFLFG